MKNLDDDVKNAGLVFLNEMGLDPGIDHMSAMQTIHELKSKGAKINSFKSYCGGVIHPDDCKENPWGYKFTWNPMNVVMAGQGTAKYLEKGNYKFTPYQQLFSRLENFEFENWGTYEGYANRDSLSYQEIYGLEETKTIIRGTLRKQGFCEAWNVFVKLGLTDNTYIVENSESLSRKEFLSTFLPGNTDNAEKALKDLFDLSPSVMDKIQWLDLFSEEKIKVRAASPAKILLSILEEKWKIRPNDRDLVLMQHQFEYELDGKHEIIYSTLQCSGINENDTAMAKTVGLPLAIGAKMVLQNKIKNKGVLIPVTEDIYKPVLEELKKYGIDFKDVKKGIDNG